MSIPDGFDAYSFDLGYGDGTRVFRPVPFGEPESCGSASTYATADEIDVPEPQPTDTTRTLLGLTFRFNALPRDDWRNPACAESVGYAHDAESDLLHVVTLAGNDQAVQPLLQALVDATPGERRGTE